MAKVPSRQILLSDGLFLFIYLCDNATAGNLFFFMFKNLVQKVRELNIPSGTFAIFGSGPMAVRGLKEPNDIDIIVTHKTYEFFKSKTGWIEKEFSNAVKYLAKDEVEIWNTWGPGEWNILELIKVAEMIDGLPYVTMDSVLMWKQKNNRPKDMADVQIIRNHLAGLL